MDKFIFLKIEKLMQQRIYEIQKRNNYELTNGIVYGKGSWHDDYSQSAWFFIFFYDACNW
jgi:hypothetical protein